MNSKKKIRDEDVFEDVSVYAEEARQRLVEDGALSNEEDGFMLGYEEDFMDNFEDEDALWWDEDFAE